MTQVKFYFDEPMPRTVEKALTQQGYEVLMAVDIGMSNKDDDTEHLPFAQRQQAVLVTRDKGFAGRASKHTNHAGLICWTGAETDVGGMIRALGSFATQYTAEDVSGNVFWLK